MKEYFVVSLIRNGVLGGGITADDESVTYHTGKVTVPAKFRRLEMRYGDIESASRSGLTVTIRMKDGEEYRFLVFAPGRFCSVLRSAGVEVKN